MISTQQEPIATSDDLFLMANLSSVTTGLPFIVWVSSGQGIQHDVRVKVARGTKVKPSEFISVALRPDIRVVTGELSAYELKQLSKWIRLNLETIMAYWNDDLDTAEMIGRLHKLEGNCRSSIVTARPVELTAEEETRVSGDTEPDAQ